MTQIDNISFFGIRARPHMFDRLFAYQTWRETFSGQDNKTYGGICLAIVSRHKFHPQQTQNVSDQCEPNPTQSQCMHRQVSG